MWQSISTRKVQLSPGFVLGALIENVPSALMKKFVKVDYAGMPNIIINKMLIPELLQENFTSANLVSETKKFFQDNKYKENLFRGYEEIKNNLGETGASIRAATIIVRAFQK